MRRKEFISLSDEQYLFVRRALEGHNILVDACIGSGKTTAIQQLCNTFPDTIRILYLTYNRLLKLDAKSKIKNANVQVTNYHGFAYGVLLKLGIKPGISDSIQEFLKVKPQIPHFDVLIIDEYQDIEQEHAELLEYIKDSCPGIQIVAVGDMAQKIYDKTTLEVLPFMEKFLGDYITLAFTKCFRISADLAAKLGRIWQKEIIGVNDECVVEEMSFSNAIDFISEQKPRDILCLGSRGTAILPSDLSRALNQLEDSYPDKFNKKTVYASIKDNDAFGKTAPTKTTAIFTTYDSSKGLERNICVIFDYTESYWSLRVNKPQQKYEILRNIFCVAASRGKEHIIFVKNNEALLSEKSISENPNIKKKYDPQVDISEMFDFKYIEDIEDCYALLDSTLLLTEDKTVIDIKPTDDLIDLSPCIGTYQEAVFFDADRYSIDKQIEWFLMLHPNKKNDLYQHLSLDEKILYLTALETQQDRYRKQVATPFVSDIEKNAIIDRLALQFSPQENVQVPCKIPFYEKDNPCVCFEAMGLADVVKSDIVYELKFVSELTHAHFLQCACYMVALGKEVGVLWNTRNNQQYEIRIPDRKAFLDAVTKATTRGEMDTYFGPPTEKKKTVKTETTSPLKEWFSRKGRSK